MTCPECGNRYRLGSKFCDKCGHNFAMSGEKIFQTQPLDDKIKKIQKYLPRGLTEKILSQKDRIEGERKYITVMFCDLKGYTSLSERLGPEEAYAIMDEIYEILIYRVHRYDGTVNEMTGDGIVALFGAPIALEDAPQRAIRSSLAIHREIAKFSDRMMQVKKISSALKMRIGIHTGPVVVGTMGNDLRVEFKAVGDTVNIAARMEEIAEPGSTYVTKDVFKLTEGLFRSEALGAKTIKGKRKLVDVYRVIAPSNQRTRFDVSAERGLTHFMGRERELGKLNEAYIRSKSSRGQVVSIMAEPGLGKSRLLYEFRKILANDNITFLEGKCFSFSKGVAYHPIVDILKANFHVIESDKEPDIRSKITKAIHALELDETALLPYLLELFAIKDSGIEGIPITPEARKDRTIEALKKIVLRGSEFRPLVIAAEDLHWIDNLSEECLNHLIDAIAGARVTFILTHRPEYEYSRANTSYYSQIILNRLSNSETMSMVKNLVGYASVDSGVEDIIIEKTEGNPFFIETFISSFKEMNVLEEKGNKVCLVNNFQEMTIPSTIHDVIMAKVDNLPENAKEVLLAGSAIEREFSFELIKAVMASEEHELLSMLSVLVNADLIYERGIHPDKVYVFKHSLTREVVYDSLLSINRKKLHQRVGFAIEELYKPILGEHYGALVEHFLLGETYEKGAEYARYASKIAQKNSAYNDAISYSKKNVFCLEQLVPNDEIRKKIVNARISLALYCLGINNHVEAMNAVAPILEIAHNPEYQKKLAMIYVATGAYESYVVHNFRQGIEGLNKARNLAEKYNDFISLWFANFFLGSVLALNNEFENSEACLLKALELSHIANNVTGICFSKSALSAQTYCISGKIDEAYKTSKDSVRLARDSGDIYNIAMALTCHGSCCYFKGQFRDAENSLLEAISLHEKTGHIAWMTWANFYLGDVYLERCKLREARSHYRSAFSLLKNQHMFPCWIDLISIKIMLIDAINGKKGVDLSRQYSYEIKSKFKFLSGLESKLVAEILMNIDEKYYPEAEKWIKKAIVQDRQSHTFFQLAIDYAFYAKLLIRKGDKLNSHAEMDKAIEIFKECGADGWVGRYKNELKRL